VRRGKLSANEAGENLWSGGVRPERLLGWKLRTPPRAKSRTSPSVPRRKKEEKRGGR